MGFIFKMETPHGIALEEAYANIDFFSMTKRDNHLIFNLAIYKDRQAYIDGFAPIPDTMIVDGIPVGDIDLGQDIPAQIYDYISAQAQIAGGDGDFLAMYQDEKGRIVDVDMQYVLLKNAVDVLEEGQENKK